tara:strand:- start:4977 stop:5666 length:690 start_codon:yes stop_codon:yes gene_type:complete
MKLNEEEIQALYQFTRAHFVYHFDVQTELVDHLANGIELEQAKNPNVTFQEALHKEFKKFGVFGFQGVVEKRQKALSKKYWKLILRFYKAYFSLPKIMLTLCLSTLLFTLLKAIPVTYQHYTLLGIFMLFLIPATLKMVQYQKIIKRKERKWMLEEMLLTQMGFFSIIQLPIQLVNIKFEIENDYILGVVSIFTVSLLLLFYVLVFVIPSKAGVLLAETYPEYKMLQIL